MPNLNSVHLIGTLTRDPEMKYSTKGTAIAEIGMAINRTYTAENGEKREDVTFVDITLWGRVAEVCGEYCKKGHPLFVEGRLQLDSWDDKATGQKRSKLKVVGENIQLLHRREGTTEQRQQGEPRQPATGRTTSAPPPRRPAPTQPDPDLDPEPEIPF